MDAQLFAACAMHPRAQLDFSIILDPKDARSSSLLFLLNILFPLPPNGHSQHFAYFTKIHQNEKQDENRASPKG